MVMFPPTCSLPVPQMQLHLYPQTAGCLLDHPLMCSLDACWALDEEREVRERHMSNKGVNLNVSNQFKFQGVQERYKISKAGACKAAKITGNQMNQHAAVCMKSSCFCFKLPKPLLCSFSVVSQHNYTNIWMCVQLLDRCLLMITIRVQKHHQGQLIELGGLHRVSMVVDIWSRQLISLFWGSCDVKVNSWSALSIMCPQSALINEYRKVSAVQEKELFDSISWGGVITSSRTNHKGRLSHFIRATIRFSLDLPPSSPTTKKGYDLQVHTQT